MRDNQNNGVTLLELLIVLAIVLILAALLLPVLNRVRAKSRAIYCTNNLKQWGIAVQLYVNDWKEYLPTEGSAGSPGARGAWYNTLPRQLGMKAYKDVAGQGTSIQRFEPLHIWVCPEKNRISPVSASSANSFFYAMNERMNDRNGSTTGHIVLNSIVLPGEMVFLFDVDAHSPSGSPTSSFNRVPYPNLHTGGCNFLFLDGHVAWYPTAAYAGGVTHYPGLHWYPGLEER